jgi:hypothetical protein
MVIRESSPAAGSLGSYSLQSLRGSSPPIFIFITIAALSPEPIRAQRYSYNGSYCANVTLGGLD